MYDMRYDCNYDSSWNLICWKIEKIGKVGNVEVVKLDASFLLSLANHVKTHHATGYLTADDEKDRMSNPFAASPQRKTRVVVLTKK